MRARDRIIGIVLGLVLGVAIVVGFVFWGSEQTIDSASLGNGGGKGAGHARAPGEPPVRTVHVFGGAPPPQGGPTLQYRKGDHVRIRVISDSAVDLEVFGYGITRAVPADRPTLIEFDATKTGTFPLINPATHIGVADIRVGGGPPL